MVLQDGPLEQVRNTFLHETFQSSTVNEKLLFLLGVVSAIMMGIMFPFLIVAYAEQMNMLVARSSPDAIVPQSFLLQLFGGGDTNSSGTYEERMNRLVDDSWAYFLATSALTIVQFVCAVLSIYCLNYSSRKKVGRIRCHLLKNILHQDIAWHDTSKTGAFASTFTDGLAKIQEGTGEKVGMFAYLVTTFVASVVVSMFYGWELSLVMAAISPVFVIIAVVVARLQTTLTTKESQSYGAAGSVVEEVLSNIRTVMAYGGENKEIERYKQNLVAANRVGIKGGVYSGVGGGASWMLVFFAYALCFWYGTPLIIAERDMPDKTYTPGVVLIILFGVVAGATHLGFCTPHLETFAKARGAYVSVMTLLHRRPTIDVQAPGLKLDKIGDIEFNNVHFSYPSRPDVKILQGLTFKVKAGENVALVGGSGSGKSTIIQLLERFYEPDFGCITISGVDIKKLDLRWMRRQIGLVGQEPVLFNMTVGKNICCDMKVNHEDIEHAAREANAYTFITKLPQGYDTMVGERGTQLSGGQKQRIAIARALLRRPSVLLLDEATSALDVANEAVVQSALEQASKGRTTLTVSHRLSGIRNVDRILVMANGCLAEEGTHAELMEKKGHYYSLITADASLEEDSKMEVIETNVSSEKHFDPQDEADLIVTEVKTKENEIEEPYHASLPRIISLNRPDWPYVLAGSVASFFNGCISPASAILFGNIFGVLSEPDEEVIISSTNTYSLGFIVVGVCSLLFVFIQMSTLTLAGVRMTSRLRVDVFQAMLRQEMAWFDDERQGVGSLCAKLSGDTSSIQAATGSKLGSLLQGVSCLGVGTIMSFFYSWKMTILCIICVPFTLMSIIFEARVMESEGSAEKQALEEATKVAVEALAAVRTVQSLGQEPAVVERYTCKLAEAETALKRKTRYRGITWAISQTSTSFCYGVSLALGGYLVAKKGESYKNIVIVSEALLFGAWMLAHVVSFAPNLQQATISAGRLFKILDRKPQLYTTTNSSMKTWNANGQIDFNNVHFAYPNRPVVKILQGIDLSILKGKKVALVGPSGCGKSTIIQLLQRFYDPVSGSVNIANQDTINVPIQNLRAEIGIVSQEPVLFDRTIAENIAYGDNSRLVSMSEVITAAKHANVHAFITSLPAGYETRLGSKGTQLSGGQKQRIAIARALVRNPKIIILDEATSALDSQSEKLVQEALDEASAGRTCIVIAHRLSTVTNADVICVLHRGRVAELGSHSELLVAGGHYTRLLQGQQAPS